MKVGDLVKYLEYIGIVTCVDPEEIGGVTEVEVLFNDGDCCTMSVWNLEVINEE